jgi:hypothetical protein
MILSWTWWFVWRLDIDSIRYQIRMGTPGSSLEKNMYIIFINDSLLVGGFKHFLFSISYMG